MPQRGPQRRRVIMSHRCRAKQTSTPSAGGAPSPSPTTAYLSVAGSEPPSPVN
jgi:hypothetical protein